MDYAYASTGMETDKTTVLVVEDEILLRMVLADKLRDDGYTVIEAANADEALSILQSNTTVGLVVTDRNMPGDLDGGALARRIRREHRGLKVVMVSGEEPGVEVQRVLHGFFRKPCNVAALSAYLRSLVSLPDALPS